MSLGKQDVEKIARLARLAIAPTEVPGLAQQLSGILAFVAQMNAADTAQVQPMAHPYDLPTRMRPDEVTEGNERDLLQSIAPAVKAGLYLVPRVIE